MTPSTKRALRIRGPPVSVQELRHAHPRKRSDLDQYCNSDLIGSGPRSWSAPYHLLEQAFFHSLDDEPDIDHRRRLRHALIQPNGDYRPERARQHEVCLT